MIGGKLAALAKRPAAHERGAPSQRDRALRDFNHILSGCIHTFVDLIEHGKLSTVRLNIGPCTIERHGLFRPSRRSSCMRASRSKHHQSAIAARPGCKLESEGTGQCQL